MTRTRLTVVALALQAVIAISSGRAASDPWDPDTTSPPPSSGGSGPEFPGTPYLSEKTSTSMRVSWAPSDDPLFFYRRIGFDGDWVLVAERPAGALGPPIVDGDLLPDTHYCYRVIAQDPVGGTSEGGIACAHTDRQPVGRLVGSLRLLTYNVYGFDDDLCLGGPCLSGSNQCEIRQTALGEAIANATPPYDVVGVQEHYDVLDFGTWTCDAKHLTNAVLSTNQFPYRLLHQPNGESVVGIPSGSFTEVDGGIGIFSRHVIAEKGSWEWPWTPWVFESPTQGFIFARIRVPGVSDNVTVDVYVLHTYGNKECNEACHAAELEMLAEKIHERSATSGNPVIVMGDFNIDGPPAELDAEDTISGLQYETVIREKLRSPTDLWLENHPGDFGFTKRCNKAIPNCWYFNYNEADPTRRIDYIFVATDPYLTNSPYEVIVRNRDDVATRAVVAPAYGIHVSDHVGLEATIEIRRRQGTVTLPGNVLLPVDLG
jgi:endonuclease/exonuclease/phosphatase family metal-dependent hydrolase